jgi:glycosyltransferase involved in cell wall biosynthesis
MVEAINARGRRMRRLLIMDISTGGHHPRYLKWIIDSEACRESEIYVAARPELLNHDELESVRKRIHLIEFKLSPMQESTLADTTSPAALVRRQFTVKRIWRDTFADLSRHTELDLVFLPFADECLDSIALTGSPFNGANWAGITFRPMFHFQDVGVKAPAPRFSAGRRAMFRRALRERHLAGLFTIDPTLPKYVAERFNSTECARLRFLPDPTVDHQLVSTAHAREILGIPADARTVLAYGALTERKGIRTLIDCAANSRCAENVHLILAGAQSPEMRALLQGTTAERLRQQNRLHLFDGYQSDQDEARLLSASDCMWVGYKDFYVMSGVMLLAARHGIPCLVSKPGIAGYLMKKHGFGLLVDCDDDEKVVAALNRIASAQEEMKSAGQRGIETFRRHSITEFQKEISALVESVSGRISL